MKYYLHLIDLMPAHFDGEQICFNKTGQHGIRKIHPLALSLEQIRKEQSECKAFRVMRGFGYIVGDYSYCTVDTPDQNSGEQKTLTGEHCK